MTLTSGCIGPGEPLPPPVPLRSPQRVETSPMNNDRGQMKDRENHRPTEPPSPSAQKIFQEIDREIEDTQQRLVSAVFANRDGGVRLQAKDIAGGIGVENMKERPSEIRRSSLLWSEGDEVSWSSTSSSLTDGLKRYSAYLSFSRQPSLRSTEEKASRQRHIEDAAARLRISYDSPESPTTIASYDGASNADSMAQEDARVEAWLARRGSFAAEPSEVDRVSQTSMTPTAAPEQRRPARTVAPSQSSGNSRREYASPLSPMNNGRDAYGNFIPTNTQDYLNSQSPPSSPPLRPIMEDAQSGSTTTPSLRGGGSWWHLGLGQNGKEPSVKKGRSTPKSERSFILKSKTSLVTKDPLPSSLANPQAEGASANPYASAKARSAIATDYEWSDEESERSSFDLEQRRLSKLLKYGTDAQSRNARIGESTTLVAPNTPASSKPMESPEGGFPYPLLPGLPVGAKERLDARWAGGLKPPRRLQPDDDRTESPFSDLSYETRREKRWNKAPSEAPAVMPPPPPPKDVAPPKAPPSFVKPITHTQYAYEYGQPGEGMSQPASPSHYLGRAPSLDDPRDEEAWELQSLQLGESVSVVGGPRRGRALAVARPPVPPINAEQYKAQQLTAQAEFRGLCQEIMMRYNAEISRLQREFQRGALSQERLRHHKELLDKNRANALKHSAKSANYLILEDENAIIEAMKTINGYHIYHDLLHTTRPAGWQRLLEQYRAATTVQKPPSTPDKPRSESSSFDRARHATGKLARFLLAAPSDAELKTFSKHSKHHVNPREFGTIPPVWLNPMVVSAIAGAPQIVPARSPRPSKDKGKGREVLPGPISSQGIDERDFAPSTTFAPSRMPESTAAGSNGRWTGTTAVPSTRVVRAAEHVMRDERSKRPAQTVPASVVSEESLWPESDSQGNWFDAKKARLRGGGGSKKMKKSKAKAMRWLMPLDEEHRRDAIGFMGTYNYGP